MRLLMVAHGAGRSGYGRVARGTLGSLPGGIDRRQFAVDVGTAACDEKWTVYPNTVEGDPHGHRQVAELVAQVEPDVVLVHHEPWVFAAYHAAMRSLAVRPRVAYYCPVEGVLACREVVQAAFEADLLVAQTEFGARELRRAMGDRPGAPSPVSIPCGVDPAVFRPLSWGPPSEPAAEGVLTASVIARSRRDARSTLWPDRDDVQGAFVVLNANLWSPRKDVERTLEGFAELARRRPSTARLCCLRPLPSRRGPGLYDRLLEEGHVLPLPYQPPFTDEQLNVVYNACDVGINTASAEGWGLCSHEHAATGAVQVVPDYAGPGEVWAGVGVVLDVEPPRTRPGDWFEHRRVALEAVVDALVGLHGQWESDGLGELSVRAHAHATQPGLRWKSIGAAWSALLAQG